MVVIRSNRETLEEYFGLDWKENIYEFSRIIGFSFEPQVEDDIKIELNPDRPDLYSIASLFNCFQIYKTGKMRNGKIFLKKENISVHAARTRPYFVVFMTDGLKDDNSHNILNQDFLEYSDRVSESVGKSRSKFAIGAHDLSAIRGKIVYGPVDANEVITTYDGMKGKISELLTEHEKGIKYQLLQNNKEVVGVSDESGIISVPPFFNSYRTRVTSRTERMLVDITATSQQGLDLGFRLMAGYFLSKGINISLPERYSSYQNNLSLKKIKISSEIIKNIVGIKVNEDTMLRTLAKMGIKYNERYCSIPIGRVDIMGEVDIIEDFIKGYGIENIHEGVLENNFIGKENRINHASNVLRELMVGLGFQEVKNFVLSDSIDLDQFFQINNPKSSDFSRIRQDLLSSLIRAVERNRAQPFPQTLFEVGDCIRDNGTQETSLGCIMSGKSVSYDTIKGVLDALLRALNVRLSEIRPTKNDHFINGRSGNIIFSENNSLSNFLGEVHPFLLEKFNIPFPTVYLELSLGSILTNSN
jgi:phenylalanyl-tRNA synthetase beta chain